MKPRPLKMNTRPSQLQYNHLYALQDIFEELVASHPDGPDKPQLNVNGFYMFNPNGLPLKEKTVMTIGLPYPKPSIVLSFNKDDKLFDIELEDANHLQPKPSPEIATSPAWSIDVQGEYWLLDV